MRSKCIRATSACLLAFAVQLSVGAEKAWASHPFTVADDIALGMFGDNSDEGKVRAITWSPDRQFVAVHVGRGLLAKNKAQSELRIYSAGEMGRFLAANAAAAAPKPLW